MNRRHPGIRSLRKSEVMRRIGSATAPPAKSARLPSLVVLALVLLALVPAGAQAKPSSGPTLEFTPSTGGTYDFGAVDASTTASQDFTLTNTRGGAAPALNLTVTGSSAFTITAESCKSLGPGKSCGVTVEYAPTGGSDSATLTATSKKSAASIELTGTSGSPDVQVSPGDFVDSTGLENHYSFVGFEPPSQTFTLTNLGTGATDSLAAPEVTEQGGSWAVTNSTCAGVALAPSASCAVTVEITDLGCGLTSAELRFASAQSLTSYLRLSLGGPRGICGS